MRMGYSLFKFPGNNDPQDSIIFSSIGYKQQAISINDALKQKRHRCYFNRIGIGVKRSVVVKPLTIKQPLDSIGHS